MKPKALHGPFAILTILLVMSASLVSRAQTDMYRVIENRITVDTSPELAWKVLADFTGVSEFHALFDESNLLRGEEGMVQMGSERESHIPDGINNVILKERVTDMKEGSFYSYTVYEWENIELEGMQVTYGVGLNELGQTEIYNRTVYRMRSGIITGLMRSRFDRGSKDSLISFKYFIETGQDEKDLKKLRKWHKKRQKNPAEADYLVSNDPVNP